MSEQLGNTNVGLSSYITPVVTEIKELMDTARRNVATQVNQELLTTYWKIGEIIVHYEQNDQIRAAYGEKTLRNH